MATRPNISLPGQHGGSAPQHFVPPTARELRAQAVHRLQVGLLGLAAMLLLVALASIIMERARMAESTLPPAAGVASSTASPKSDPLADIGVIPSPDAARTPQAAPNR
ncbi:hypothetical protein ACFOD9_05055 [Novosphingobium bradum]|uniref:Uncharacterized protein n=1 Tax=Novosphingobium bradum TaxID=1737444 RepID=A0ABV7ILS1_9SPHN